MYRAAMLIVVSTLVPSVAAAQQPCTTDANRVVAELYRHMLERSTDPDSAHWVQQLERGRMTVRQVVRDIATSPEHTQRFWRTEVGEEAPYVRAVGTLYRHVLGRQPDAAGARSHAELGATRGVDAVVDAVVNSREYDNAFGDWSVPGSGGVRYCGPGGVSTTTSAQPAPRMARRFRGMDASRDGVISRGEWRGSARSFEIHDVNHDGVLSGDEVRAGAPRAGRIVEDEELTSQRFEFLDTNNNGRIELREWEGSLVAFDRIDTNSDNRINRAEFAASVRTLGVAPTSGFLIVVDPTETWTDTGLTVRAGELLTFDAEGTVQLSADPNDIADPGGARSGRRAAAGPLTSALAGTLVARIGTTGVIFVGDRRPLRAPSSGRLYLGVNDDHLADNSGEFRVTVTVD